jgi:hypothetical protein
VAEQAVGEKADGLANAMNVIARATGLLWSPTWWPAKKLENLYRSEADERFSNPLYCSMTGMKQIKGGRLTS